MLLVLDPERVRLDRVEPGDTRSIAELMPLLREGGVDAVAANGVLGDPTAASADEGLRLFAAMIDDAWSRLRAGRADERGCLVPDPGGGDAARRDPTTGAIS